MHPNEASVHVHTLHVHDVSFCMPFMPFILQAVATAQRAKPYVADNKKSECPSQTGECVHLSNLHTYIDIGLNVVAQYFIKQPLRAAYQASIFDKRLSLHFMPN